jgi:chaperone BCS1
LKKLVQDAIDFSEVKDTSSTQIYEVHRWGLGWEKVMAKKPRSMDSVILDSDIANTITEDIQRFNKNGDWYVSKGVPYRRGYLLHGPPGTGKTSFVQAVAANLKLNICYLNLSGGNLNDDSLNNLLNNSPLKSIILIEDIDAIFLERNSVQASRINVSFSGLLNALDGVRSQEGRVLVMTTNHPEKLDPALLRPGRADVKVKLNYASVMQMQGMYKKFFPKCTADQPVAFSNELPDQVLSMAKLQGHFLKHRDQPESAITDAKNLLDVDFQIKDMSIYEWLRRLNFQKFAP